MPKLKAKLTAAPSEELAEMYVEQDGVWLLDVEPVDGYTLENVSGLQTTLSDQRTRRKAATTRLEAVNSIFGDDWTPETLQTFNSELEALRSEGDLDEKVNARVATTKEQLEKKHKQELEALNTRLGQVSSWFEKSEKFGRTKAALAGLLPDEESVEIMLPHALQNVKLMMPESGGNPELVVLDERGNPRLSMKSGSTENMSVEEFVKTMADDPRYSRVFSASGAAGGGTGDPSGAGRTAGSVILLSRAEANDVPTYRAARARATKEGKTLQIQE